MPISRDEFDKLLANTKAGQFTAGVDTSKIDLTPRKILTPQEIYTQYSASNKTVPANDAITQAYSQAVKTKQAEVTPLPNVSNPLVADIEPIQLNNTPKIEIQPKKSFLQSSYSDMQKAIQQVENADYNKQLAAGDKYFMKTANQGANLDGRTDITVKQRLEDLKNVGIATAGGTIGGVINAAGTARQYIKNYNDDIYKEMRAAKKDVGEAKRNLLEQSINADANTSVKALLDNVEKEKKELNIVRAKDDIKYTPETKLEKFGFQRLEAANKATADLLEGMTSEEQFLTQTFLSALQNAELMPLALIPVVGQGATLAIMSTSAAGRTAYDKTVQGKTLNDAFWSGVLDGSIEAATEIIPVGEWLNIVRGEPGTIAKAIAKSAGSEAAEEFVGYIANYLVDVARQDPEAEFSLSELMNASLSGALSGALLAGSGVVVNNFTNRTANTNVVNQEAVQQAKTEIPADILEEAGITQEDLNAVRQNPVSMEQAQSMLENDITVTPAVDDVAAELGYSPEEIQAAKANPVDMETLDTENSIFSQDSQEVSQDQNVLTNQQDSANVESKLRDISSLQGERNNLSERSSNELRELQAEGIRNLAERGFSDKGPEIDDLLRGRISDILGREMGRRYGGHGNDSRILKVGKGAKSYNIIQNVDGDLFHDIFSTARLFLQQGELVDVHPINSADGWTGYNETQNYISDDGLSGFAITKDGDLISVFNLNEKGGFLKGIAPIIKANAKTLDCYDIGPTFTGHTLPEFYNTIFGFEVTSTDTYNWDYDHDGIGDRYHEPTIAYMVNPNYVEKSNNTGTSNDVSFSMPENQVSESNDKIDIQPKAKKEKIDIQPKRKNVVILKSAIPLVTPLFEEDVIPNAKKAFNLAKDIKIAVNDVVNPFKGADSEAVDSFFRLKGQRDKRQFQLEKTGERIKKDITSKMSEADRMNFFKNFETGKAQQTAELDKLAQYYEETFKALAEERKGLTPDFMPIEHYFPHIWNNSNAEIEKAMQTLSYKRGMQGDKSFLKQRFYATIEDGMRAGLTLKSTDPEVLFEYAASQQIKYNTAKKYMQELKDGGYIKYFSTAETMGRVPAGYMRIDDNIARTYFKADAAPLGQVGEYYAVEPVGKILHNWLMPNWFRGNVFGNTLVNLKNFTTKTEMALSGFHWIQTGISAVQAETGLAIQKAVNLKDVGSAFKIPIAPLSVAKSIKTGSQYMSLTADRQRFMNNPKNARFLKAHPQAEQMMNTLWNNGLKLTDTVYKNDMSRTAKEEFKNIFKTGNVIGGGVKTVYKTAFQISDAITKPLFETVIPSLKVAHAMEQLQIQMDIYADDIASGKKSVNEIARKAIDQVDDIYGAMNYDNRNWNKNVKQALQIVYRSPTWWYGNMHMFGNIANETSDVAKTMFNNITKGTNEKVILGQHTGFAMGLGIWSAVVGTLMGLLLTGKMPEDVKDIFFPKTGEKDSNGNDKRVSTLGYFRSWYQTFHDPFSTVRNAQSGMFSTLSQLKRNEDYYGNTITENKGAAKALDYLEYFVTEAVMPFSLSNIYQDVEDENFKEIVFDMMGVNNAPKSVQRTKFQNELIDLYSRKYAQKYTSKYTDEEQQLRKQLNEKIYNGTATDEEKQKAIEEGWMSTASVSLAYGLTYLYDWTKMSKEDRNELWDKASDSEKQELARVEVKKDLTEQTPKFVEEWKSGKLKVPGQDVYSESTMYKNADFDLQRAAVRKAYQYQTNVKNTALKQKDEVSSTYKAIDNLVQHGVSDYDAAFVALVLSKDYSDTSSIKYTNSNGKETTYTYSSWDKQVVALAKYTGNIEEAVRLVNIKENQDLAFPASVPFGGTGVKHKK